METANASKNTVRYDVQKTITGKVVEQLKDGVVPWRVSWVKAGIPENLVSHNPYKGVNLILLSALGYERNLFLTSNQLKEIQGAIKATEKPHVVSYWNSNEQEGDEKSKSKKKATFTSYTVFNVAQCMWQTDMPFPPAAIPLHPEDEVEALFRWMPEPPLIQSEDQGRAYYNPIEDFINMPAEEHFPSKAAYYEMYFHELVHGTGHRRRLNRKDLIQMSEFGHDAFSHEELVAEIGASHLLSHVGFELPFTPSKEYLEGWIQKLEADKYFLFSAASQAQKAIDYILNMEEKKEA